MRLGAASERSTCFSRTCFEAKNYCHTWPHAVEFPIRFGDGTPTADSGAHTYERADWFSLSVQCTDTTGSPWATVRAEIEVLK
jgi:hypothetical protein